MNSQFYFHIHPGKGSNIQIGSNKTMYINSRGECSTSRPAPSAARESYAERTQRWDEEARKRRQEATKKRMEDKQKRREELMRGDHRFEDMPVHTMRMMTNGRRGTENFGTDRVPVDTDRDTVDTDRDPVDTDQETTDAKKCREERHKIRDEVKRGTQQLGELDMSRIDWLRMMENRRGMNKVGRPVDTDRDTVDTDRNTVDTDRNTVDTDRDTVDTDAKKRREERQKKREEAMRESHPLGDLDMSRIHWLRMMENRKGMKHVDPDRDPVNKVGRPVDTDRNNVDTDRDTMDTDATKRREERQKKREEAMRVSHPLGDLDMSRIDWLRMMETRRDPVSKVERPVETDRDTVDTDAKKRMEERQENPEDMRGSHPFNDFVYLDMMTMNGLRRRDRGRKIHTDNHEEDMRSTNINPDIRNIGEKGTNEDMDTEMENEDIDRDSVSSKGVCSAETDRGTVDTDREEVDTDRESVDTGRGTDRDSADTGLDTMDTDRESVDTGRDTDTYLDTMDTDRDNMDAIREIMEDKHRILGSLVSDVENDDETKRKDAKEKKNINLEGKYNGVNEDDYTHDRGNEDEYKYDGKNKQINSFTMTNNGFDDNDFTHTTFTRVNNFGGCTNIQIGNHNKMVFSSTSNTPAFGFSFGQKNRNAWKRTEEYAKARQDMAKLKREEAMKKRQRSDKIKLQIFEDHFTNRDPKGVYPNRWGDDDNDDDADDDDTDHKMTYEEKYDDRDRKVASDKLKLVLLSKKIWSGGDGCRVNLDKTVSIQELEDVLKLKLFGVVVNHIYRERLGPIYRFEMDLNRPISEYSVQDGDQVILL